MEPGLGSGAPIDRACRTAGCPTHRDFRALALFGRRPLARGESPLPASENRHISGRRVNYPSSFARRDEGAAYLENPDLHSPSKNSSACSACLNTARGWAVPLMVKEGCNRSRA